ncbi:hypothetical protein BDD12DRAFT_907270 [Trichophaea hybrida]|nr:hypothetical protein BDD12DRAFT_907270 [Trichophaea hybrida]
MEWFSIAPISGIKRPAENDLTHEAPLAKRLELLSIRPPPSTHHKTSKPHHHHPSQETRMEVDNVVYIDTLSDSDSDSDSEEKVIFIPDVEKRLTKIPEHVLQAPGSGLKTPVDTGGTSTDLILYSVPKSLSVAGDEGDGVRKAIIESRARLRMKREAEERERRNTEADAAAAMNVMATNGVGGGMMSNVPVGGMVNGFSTVPASVNGVGMGSGPSAGFVCASVYDPDEMEIE